MNDEYEHIVGGLLYTSSNVPGPGSRREDFDDVTDTCDCTTDCSNYCSHLIQYGPNYENGLLLWTTLNSPIFECNSTCVCQPFRCSNRIVQLGPNPNLEIVSTSEKGNGLITKIGLERGQFVCEYAGEVIGEETARQRFQIQLRNQSPNYIIVLREYGGSKLVYTTIIDPTVLGNIGRYLNHSCEPNLLMVPVRIGSTLPRLALFAARQILQGEELCFDYGDPGQTGYSTEPSSTSTSPADLPDDSNHSNQRSKCLCRSPVCRQFLPFDKDLLGN